VDEVEALARLPEAYAAVLRLRANGLDDERIAALLGLKPEGVDPLVRVARAKLAALREKAGDEEDVAPS
jgi:DNA-directed RNA polymerase specialized sigma24 family protein